MQRLIPLLLILPICVLAQEKKFSQQITRSSNVVLSKEQNYQDKIETDKQGNRTCIVTMDVEINGKWYPAKGSYRWDGGMLDGRACEIAATKARERLTAEVQPSIISSKTEISSEENSNTKDINGYKVGEKVDIGNLKSHPNYTRSFAHKGTECRWFYDWIREEKGIKQYNLIACKISAGWVVEDRFTQF